MKRFRKALIALLTAALLLGQATSAIAGERAHANSPRSFPGDPGDGFTPGKFPGDKLNFPGDPGDS